MLDSPSRKAVPFRAVEPCCVSALEERPADGCYRVLATLGVGAATYRVFAELVVDGDRAEFGFIALKHQPTMNGLPTGRSVWL